MVISEPKDTLTIIDGTEQSLVAFRRNVYLTIQSSLDFQEAAHKLLKIDLKPGQDVGLREFSYLLPYVRICISLIVHCRLCAVFFFSVRNAIF